MKRTTILLPLIMFFLITLGCAQTANQNIVENENVADPRDGVLDGQDGEKSDSTLFIPLDFSAEIEITTPENGNGPHPLFRWEAVDRAELYMLFVFDSSGGAYWAWEGEVTEIFLGGFISAPPDDVFGPILVEPMEWAVVAISAEGEFIGSSKVHQIAP